MRALAELLAIFLLLLLGELVLGLGDFKLAMAF